MLINMKAYSQIVRIIMKFPTCFFSACLLLLPALTQAKEYSSPTLTDAYEMLDTTPEQAYLISERILSVQRKNEFAEKPNSHNEDDNLLAERTPTNLIEALQVQALALHKLGRLHEALVIINASKRLADEQKLIHLALESQFIAISINWSLYNKPTLTLESLKDLALSIDASQANQQQYNELLFHQALLSAEVESFQQQNKEATYLYQQAFSYLSHVKDPKLTTEYHLSIGSHYLLLKQYDQALTELLSAYWLAVSGNNSGQLARSNYLLAQLFFHRKVMDKSLEYASQAAEFYARYNDTTIMADVLSLMAEIYFKQGRYNLALVHYFNVLDQEQNQKKQNLTNVIDLRLDIANIYYLLSNYVLSEQYLNQAERLNSFSKNKNLQVRAQFQRSQLLLIEADIQQAVKVLNSAILVTNDIKNQSVKNELLLQGNRLLSSAFEADKNYADALRTQRKYEQLFALKQATQNEINEDVFRQQKEIIEKTIHYQGLEQQLKNKSVDLQHTKNTTFVLISVVLLLSGIVILLIKKGRRVNSQLHYLHQEFFTHPRSGLRNLRLLTAHVPESTPNSGLNIEQWHLRELINEPLSDLLSFALIEFPFLRPIYLENGYQQALDLEKEFGQYLKDNIQKPNRIYHFSDATFLYIEQKSDSSHSPKQLFDKIQGYVDNFKPNSDIDRTLNIGFADYPFLSKAYTAINDKELIDILLMATQFAKKLEHSESASHWVHLSAIDNAPAASFATTDIRAACQQAIESGLIKVQSSDKS